MTKAEHRNALEDVRHALAILVRVREHYGTSTNMRLCACYTLADVACKAVAGLAGYLTVAAGLDKA